MVPILFVMVPPTIVSLTTDSGGDRRDLLGFASWLVGCTWAQTRAATYQRLLIVHYHRPSPSFSAIHHTCSPLHIPMYVYSCYTTHIAIYGCISTCTVLYGRVEISLMVWVQYGITLVLTCQDMAINPLWYSSQPYAILFFCSCISLHAEIYRP